MANTKRKSKARIEQSALLPPNPVPGILADRDKWIEQACEGFISRSRANRDIYKSILEALWPKGHGIPGPVVNRESIRDAVNAAKGKPYLDVFRRLRELQGDEGFLGIVKQGAQYQLIDLNVYPKKTPRSQLPDEQWSKVVDSCNNVCAACGCTPGENGFNQDHKVPRARGGTDAITNWQTLCESCNNAKSVACRGCKEDCTKCGWAFPEFYHPILLSGPILRLLHEYADKNKLDPSAMVTEWILENLNRE